MSFIFFTGWDVIINKIIFNPEMFGKGFGLIIAAAGIAKYAGKDTEPKLKENT
jgi:hypothetical protein